MIACPGCGMSLRFDPEKQRLVCDYCDNIYYPEEMKAGKNADSQASYEDENYSSEEQYLEGTLFTCPQCGGEILSDSDTAVTFCSYCGVSVELTGRTVKMKAPSYVIPFQKTKEECQKIYSSFLKGALYAPDYMKDPGQLEKLRGIYMPYWVYEFQHDGPMSFAGKKSYRRGDYIITDHYNLSTNSQLYYKGISFDASSSFSDTYSQAIAPYDMSGTKDYAPGYISGFYADTADVNSQVYEDKARAAAAADAVSLIRKNNPVLGQYNVSVGDTGAATRLQTKDSILSYFPVWFMSIRHKDRVSYAVINGQTGKIAADVPIDYKKYLLGSLLLALPIMAVFHLLLLGGMSLPGNAMSFTIFMSVVFAFIAIIIANKHLNQIYTRENSFDDEGYMITNSISEPGESPAPVKQKQNKPATKKGSVFTAFIYIGVIFLIAASEGVGGLAALGGLILVTGIIGNTVVSGSSTKTINATPPKNRVYKMPYSQKRSVLMKPFIAVGIGILSALDQFLEINLLYIDEVRYGIMLVQVVIVLISFYDIIKLHNRLTTHTPKQFNKRGGDQ